MGFLQDLLGKSSEKAAREAAAIQQQQENEAQRGRIRAGETFQTSADEIAQLFEGAPEGRGNDALEAIAQLLGLRGATGRDEQIANFRSTPGFQFAQEEGEQALQRAAQAGGRLRSGKLDKDTLRFSQGLADQTFQDFIRNLFGLGEGESARESGRTANQANTRLRGAEGVLNTTTSAFADRFRTPSPTAQGIVAGANARSAGAQNLLNTGLSLAGNLASAFAPSPGGGNPTAGRRPKFFAGEFDR